MESILQTVPQLAVYQPSLLSIALLCAAVLVQSFLAGVLALGPGEEVAGLPLKGDHTKLSFRLMRTYANSTENLSVMVATTILAIVVGVSAVAVNWLVGLHLLFRLVYWAVYYSGIGKVNGGLRTMTYVAAFLMNVILAGFVIVAMLL